MANRLPPQMIVQIPHGAVIVIKDSDLMDYFDDAPMDRVADAFADHCGHRDFLLIATDSGHLDVLTRDDALTVLDALLREIPA